MSGPAFNFAQSGRASNEQEQRQLALSRSRAVVLLTLGFWVANYAVTMSASYVAGAAKLELLAVMRAGLLVLGMGLCWTIQIVLRHLSTATFSRRVAAVLVMSLAAAEIYAWSNYFGLGLVAPERLSESIRWGVAITNVASWTWFFLAWAGLRLALEYSWDAKDEQRRATALQALAHSAKLQALHSQINPHFLFNSLNSVSALIASDRRDEADKMIGKLADFFRLTLATDPEADVALEKEIELQLAYLEIEQIRFPDLQLSVRISPDVSDAPVPALLLQPLVENAVKHGVACSKPSASISISARDDQGDLLIELEDRGHRTGSDVKAGSGIGLNNVRSRLFERFGTDASLNVRRISDTGFHVSIRMPMVSQ